MKAHNSFEVNYNYDGEVDALFIHLKKDFSYATSVELNENVILDFDSNSLPVALEILNASKILKTTKFSLRNIQQIRMRVNVDCRSISLKLNLTVAIHHMNQTQKVNTFTSNDIGIPSMHKELVTA
ncbi:MAG: DUF2283 domain-containing protein [Methanobacteriaceae archaeon]|nr:DUF2283 domain-containing protein [Methanobacteriaceae archaeon]